MVAAEKGVFALALHRQRIEADEDIIHQPRVTHDETLVGQTFQK